MMERPWCRFRREARARERRRLPQVVDSLKVLDQNRPFREADMERLPWDGRSRPVRSPRARLSLFFLRGIDHHLLPRVVRIEGGRAGGDFGRILAEILLIHRAIVTDQERSDA